MSYLLQYQKSIYISNNKAIVTKVAYLIQTYYIFNIQGIPWGKINNEKPTKNVIMCSDFIAETGIGTCVEEAPIGQFGTDQRNRGETLIDFLL